MTNQFAPVAAPKRPTLGGSHGPLVTTPRAATMMRLLGAGISHEGIVLSRDEREALSRLYGFRPEKSNERPPRPEAPVREKFANIRAFDEAARKHKLAVEAWEKWTDPRPLMQAGADRNLMRYAEADGLRLIAYLARWLRADDDPVKILVQLAIDVGWDVDPSDVEWAERSDDEDEAPEDDGDETEAA